MVDQELHLLQQKKFRASLLFLFSEYALLTSTVYYYYYHTNQTTKKHKEDKEDKEDKKDKVTDKPNTTFSTDAPLINDKKNSSSSAPIVDAPFNYTLLVVIIVVIAAFLLSIASIVMYTKAKKEIANLKNRIADAENNLKSNETTITKFRETISNQEKKLQETAKENEELKRKYVEVYEQFTAKGGNGDKDETELKQKVISLHEQIIEKNASFLLLQQELAENKALQEGLKKALEDQKNQLKMNDVITKEKDNQIEIMNKQIENLNELKKKVVNLHEEKLEIDALTQKEKEEAEKAQKKAKEEMQSKMSNQIAKFKKALEEQKIKNLEVKSQLIEENQEKTNQIESMYKEIDTLISQILLLQTQITEGNGSFLDLKKKYLENVRDLEQKKEKIKAQLEQAEDFNIELAKQAENENYEFKNQIVGLLKENFNLKNDINELENVRDLEQKKEKNKNKIKDIQEKRKIKDNEKKIKNLEDQNNKLRSLNTNLTREFFEVQNQYETQMLNLMQTKADTKEDIEQLKLLCESRKEKLDQMTLQTTEADRKIETLKNEIETIKKRYQKKQRKLKLHNETLVQKLNTEIKTIVEISKEKKEELIQAVTESQNYVISQKEFLENKVKECENAKDLVLLRFRTRKQREFKKLSLKLKNSRKEARLYHRQILALKRKVLALKRNVAKVKGRNRNLQEEIEQKEKRIKTLEQEELQANTEAKDARQQVKNLLQHSVDSVKLKEKVDEQLHLLQTNFKKLKEELKAAKKRLVQFENKEEKKIEYVTGVLESLSIKRKPMSGVTFAEDETLNQLNEKKRSNVSEEQQSTKKKFKT